MHKTVGSSGFGRVPPRFQTAPGEPVPLAGGAGCEASSAALDEAACCRVAEAGLLGDFARLSGELGWAVASPPCALRAAGLPADSVPGAAAGGRSAGAVVAASAAAPAGSGNTGLTPSASRPAALAASSSSGVGVSPTEATAMSGDIGGDAAAAAAAALPPAGADRAAAESRAPAADAAQCCVTPGAAAMRGLRAVRMRATRRKRRCCGSCSRKARTESIILASTSLFTSESDTSTMGGSTRKYCPSPSRLDATAWVMWLERHRSVTMYEIHSSAERAVWTREEGIPVPSDTTHDTDACGQITAASARAMTAGLFARMPPSTKRCPPTTAGL
mmetsp:Transcript_3700/g.15363  ORF Transcript_3700/g.15363 Transcript_3700/m.15363 type:complete len:332 (+) Transcript_3700:2786-3781(+)